ncbi:hypothetical protein BH11BAC4_BH11BAC4_09720 [soil metagenome]
MKFILSLFSICLVSCSPTHQFNKDKALFESSPVKMSFKSVADMNDSYFVIKENNFFEFYRQLFDSVKNTSYPGKYTTNGDTLLLHFYNSKGAQLLGNKALVDHEKKRIIFFK